MIINSSRFEFVGLSLCGSCAAPRGSGDTSCQGDRLVFYLDALSMLGRGFEESPSKDSEVGVLREYTSGWLLMTEREVFHPQEEFKW